MSAKTRLDQLYRVALRKGLLRARPSASVTLAQLRARYAKQDAEREHHRQTEANAGKASELELLLRTLPMGPCPWHPLRDWLLRALHLTESGESIPAATPEPAADAPLGRLCAGVLLSVPAKTIAELRGLANLSVGSCLGQRGAFRGS